MNKKFYRPLSKPVIILLLTLLLFMLSLWSDTFLTNQLNFQKNELKNVQKMYQNIQKWPRFETKMNEIKRQNNSNGLFWKNTKNEWEVAVKTLATTHRIHHLNHSIQKKDLISTHTFEMEAEHDYDILGFVHEFLMLKMGYTQVQTFILRLPTTQNPTTTATLVFNRMMWED